MTEATLDDVAAARDHMFSRAISDRSFGPPLNALRGIAARYIFYPIAESIERRDVRSEIRRLRLHYSLKSADRAAASLNALFDIVGFAGAEVPYYRNLFTSLSFDPEKLLTDPRWLADLPLLTKDIIAEQGDRMLSRPLAETRHAACKTGGSTGQKATIYYDQRAVDRSSAVTAFARQSIGAGLTHTTLHFAAELPDTPKERWPSREVLKCLAMNRSNIFFRTVAPDELSDIYLTLQRRRPFLVHGHPSTLYALVGHVEDRFGTSRDKPPFAIFESSGELLEPRQRRLIEDVFGCKVVDRYGLAELGVVAYEINAKSGLRLLESECWAESLPVADLEAGSLVLTGLRNRLMPLIRYESGDLADIDGEPGERRLTNMVGRMHDVVRISGKPYLTHHLQDVLDHRVEGIRDFQIDQRTTPATLRLVLKPGIDAEPVANRLRDFWPSGLSLQFVQLEDLVRVGQRAKFRHVVS